MCLISRADSDSLFWYFQSEECMARPARALLYRVVAGSVKYDSAYCTQRVGEQFQTFVHGVPGGRGSRSQSTLHVRTAGLCWWAGCASSRVPL